ncbi:mediator complex, subunit Med12 [Rhodotorula toruloides]|uniref:Mediator of RNA polymerase II transcription subunit 12 n=1 Tax=Rhodotorula toruloides TaxID=5286 RepID=A0A511KC16_RHOTO|nr:mediator complex, subunit Med12 [Rhodotorula toruloides]
MAGRPGLLASASSSTDLESSAAAQSLADESAELAERAAVKLFPVFYPPRDGMDEDQLGEQVVKAGYAAKPSVQAETFSAHQHIYDKLKTTDILGNLSRLVAAVQAKADERLPSYGPSTFRLPSRITLTDSKREAWFSDLASPSVPLSKLSRSIPHGYKGEKGLDMLAKRRVEVGRAVWFVRAFGGVEIQSLTKTRPLQTAISLYTSEFTTVVSEFVRKQLLETILPPTSSTPSPAVPPSSVPTLLATARARSSSSSKAGSGAGGAGGSVTPAPPTGAASAPNGLELLDEEKRKSWEDKFEYTLRLTSSLYHESLLDRPQFLRFLVSLLSTPTPSPPTPSGATSTLGYLTFVLVLVDEYWADLGENDASLGTFGRGCLERLAELEHAPPSSLLDHVRTTLHALLRSAFLANPDSFVPLLPSPFLHTASSALAERLRTILLDAPHQAAEDDLDREARETIEADLHELSIRRRALRAALAVPLEPVRQDEGEKEEDEATDQAVLNAVERLDEIEFPVRIAEVHKAVFVDTCTRPLSSSSQPSLSPSSPVPPLSLADALPLFFTYSTATPSRPFQAPHRRYAVARLIALEIDRLTSQKRRVTRSAREGARVPSVEDAFVKWVDGRVVSGGDSEGLRDSVRLLLEELLRAGVVSYGAYLQRMIARGETERPEFSSSAGAGSSNGVESIHLWMLRTVAMEAAAGGGGGAKRRVAVGGQEGVERALRTEERIRIAKAELDRLVFSPTSGPASTTSPCGVLLDTVRALTEEGSQWVLTRDVVPDGLSARLEPDTGKLRMGKEEMAVVVAVYEVAQDWSGLFQLFLVLLQLSPPPSAVLHILDVVEGHLDVWTSFDALADLGTAVLRAFDSLKAVEGPHRRRLLAFLQSLAAAGYLPAQAKETIDTEMRNLSLPSPASTLSASNPKTPPLPYPLPEIQTLLVDSSDVAIAQLASTLWFRYHSHPDWATATLESVLHILPQLDSIEPVVAVLQTVHDRVCAGIGPAVARWAESSSVPAVAAVLGGQGGSRVAGLFGRLVIEGVLSAPFVLDKVVMPVRRALLSQLTALTEPSAASSDPAVFRALQRSHAILSDVIALPHARTESSDLMETDEPGQTSSTTPATLAAEQRRHSRRIALGTRAALPAVAQAISLLVIEQEVANVLAVEDLARPACDFLVQLGTVPELQTLFTRDPKALRDGMLRSPALATIPRIEKFRPKLLLGLLAMLKDGGASTPANLVSTEDWDVFLSGLTLWRLAVSKVEVEASLERLESDVAISAADKAAAMHTLSEHFLDRICGGNGQSFLGEQIVRCYDGGAASEELVSVAFDRLADALDTLAQTGDSSEDDKRSLRTLSTVTGLLDTLQQGAQLVARDGAIERLLTAVRACISVDRLARPARDGASKEASAEPVILFLVHLVSVALRLAAALSKGANRDFQLSTLVLDICSHITFVLPDLSTLVRVPTLQTLLNPSLTIPPLAIDFIPDATFSRLTRLFGPYAPSSLVPNPWELLDHTDPSSASTAVVRKSSQTPGQLINGGPIDLAAFRAKIIETIPAVTALDAVSTISTGSSGTNATATSHFERGRQTNFDFETPCTTLSIAARDHRRTTAVTRMLSTRIDAGSVAAAASAAAAAQAAAIAQAAGVNANTRKRPASGGTESTGRQAPAPAAATASSGGASGRGAKRKSTTEVVVLDSDDETEAPSKPKKAKASASGAAGRTGGKTTASKVPASKTTKRKK